MGSEEREGRQSENEREGGKRNGMMVGFGVTQWYLSHR
jgi:hypothetical protein